MCNFSVFLFHFCFLLDDYPYPGNEEKTSSFFDPVKTIFGIIFAKIYGFFGYFKPSYLKKQWNNLIQKTWFEIVFGFFKGIFKCFYMFFWSIYCVNRMVLRVVLKLMLGEYGYVDEEEEPLVEKVPPLNYSMAEVSRAPIALMSAEDVENSRQENLPVDEGIVEDISKY